MKHLYIGIGFTALLIASIFFMCWGLSEKWGPSYDVWWGFPLTLTMAVSMVPIFVVAGINIEKYLKQKN